MNVCSFSPLARFRFIPPSFPFTPSLCQTKLNSDAICVNAVCLQLSLATPPSSVLLVRLLLCSLSLILSFAPHHFKKKPHSLLSLSPTFALFFFNPSPHPSSSFFPSHHVISSLLRPFLKYPTPTPFITLARVKQPFLLFLSYPIGRSQTSPSNYNPLGK